ncbi:hypothetical protein BCEP27_20893 [Burkholderia cepacia]
MVVQLVIHTVFWVKRVVKRKTTNEGTKKEDETGGAALGAERQREG